MSAWLLPLYICHFQVISQWRAAAKEAVY